MKTTKRIISLIAAVAVLATMFVAVPVSAATDPEGDIFFNLNFDGEENGIKWPSLQFWLDNTAGGTNGDDGFYGQASRNNYAKTVVGSASTLQVSSGNPETIEFKNVGVGQTEANASLATDTADKFGADSIFGKPYYVEMRFYTKNISSTGIPTLFGQHFEGTLDEEQIVSSGPHIQVNGNDYLVFSDDTTTLIGNTDNFKANFKATDNAWDTLKLYVDPVARTYQVWHNGNAVQKIGEEGTEPTAFKFGKVRTEGYGDSLGFGSITYTDMSNGQTVNAYLAGKNNQVLAPNRTRFQIHNAGELRIDDLYFYYPYETDAILNEMIATFNSNNNNGVIAEGATIKLPTTVPDGYESSKYEVSWSTDNERITPETGAVTTGTVSDATLTLRVVDIDNNVEATKAVKVVLPVDYSEWVVVNRVPYEIGGVKFQRSEERTDAEGNPITKDITYYSPVAGGKLSSVQFKNNTQNQVNLIAAVYNTAGRLVACEVEANANTGKLTFENLAIPAGVTDAVVKFFVWSADGKITPLTTSAQVFEEAGRKLFILSDSLYDETPITGQNSTGIGAALKNKFNTTNLPIVNLAECGATLKRFATEIVTDANTGVANQTRFEHALSQIRPGDYVLMSFGHNDTKTAQWGEPEDETTYVDGVATVGSFTYFYQKYIEAIRLAGGIPIIATPAPRGNFNIEGTPLSSFGKYISNLYALAGNKDVPFFNLHQEAKLDNENSLQNIGPEAAAGYYVGTDSELVENDYTHVNEAGANWIADMLIEMMTKVKLPFVKYVIAE